MKKTLGALLMNVFLLCSLFAQELRVEGNVYDEGGESLPGVNIIVKGSEVGTITNLDGYYSLLVPNPKDSLLFSFVGMQQVVQAVNGRSRVDVILAQKPQELGEVIVVAYGTTTKEAFTGAAETVDNKVIESRPVTSFEKALQGTTAGLMVSSASGQPGSTAAVRIRGIGSLSAGSAPLFVLDGVPMSGSISDLNPNDIESVTVLKDAAAASLYGSRAANGVVLVTTKQGKKGSTRITLNSQVGISSRISDGYPLMNSSQIYEHTWKGLYNQALIDGNDISAARDSAHNNVEAIVGFNPFEMDSPLDDEGNVIAGARLHTDTDWRDQVYKSGIIQSHNLSVAGASDLTKVFFSLGYYDDSGTTLSSNFSRYTAKVNVTHQVKKYLTAGVNTHLGYSVTNAPPGGTQGSNPVRSAEIINAASPVYNADGSYNWDNKAVFDFNPVGLAELDKYRYETKRGIINSFIGIEFLPTLSFKSTAGIDFTNNKGLNYYNPLHGNGAGVQGRGSMSQSDNIAWNISNVLTYNLQRDYSAFEVMLGQEVIGADYSVLSAQATDYSIPGYPDLVWAANAEAPGSYTTSSRMLSYLGQAKYEYDDRYYISASLRTDGSSRFSDGNEYGYFYSVGAGWRVTKENWMPTVSWLDNFKLRTSYGTSGNNNIGNYASMALYGSGANYGGYPGITPVQLGNNALQWEKITSFNIGAETRFMDRLDATVEYYQRNSDGLLFARPLSASNGIGSIYTNLAEMSNSGIEATIKYDIVNTADLYSSLGFNISTNKNTILTLATEKIVSGTKLLEDNASIYQFYMREWAGVNPDNGKPMWYVNAEADDNESSELPASAFEDPLGSGRQVTSVYSEAERVRLGTALPDFFGGLNYSINYKGLELSLYLYYSIGGQIYNLDYAANMHDGVHPGNNLSTDALRAWTPNNRYTDVPRYVANNTDQGNEMSSRFLEDASYLRLKNITLAYNFPVNLCNKLHIRGFRAFVSGENLWTITGYKGFDPEGGLNGTTSNSIPGVKVVTMGVKLDL